MQGAVIGPRTKALTSPPTDLQSSLVIRNHTATRTSLSYFHRASPSITANSLLRSLSVATYTKNSSRFVSGAWTTSTPCLPTGYTRILHPRVKRRSKFRGQRQTKLESPITPPGRGGKPALRWKSRVSLSSHALGPLIGFPTPDYASCKPDDSSSAAKLQFLTFTSSSVVFPHLLANPPVWHGPVTMMASVICTDVMSVGLHTSLPEFQTKRNSNVFPSKGVLNFEVAYGSHQYDPPTKSCSPTNSPGSSMPVSTTSQSLLASLPSFMSVFGNGPDRLEAYESDAEANTSQGTTSKRPLNIAQPVPPTFRRDSASTFESTESSPTTTISTVESSLTEPSPRSPPETPDSSSPLTPFKNLRTNSVPNHQTDMERKDPFSSSFPILPGVERAESPNKKMRNMKNLSVNTSASNRTGLQLPKLGLSNPPQTSSAAFSAPPTPAFIVPPKMPRKKPSTLPLMITTPDSSTSGQDRPSAAPQSPSDPQIRTLRLLQTSSNGALFSPTVAPEGGMRLPPFAAPATSSRPSTTGGRIGKARPPLSVSPLSSLDHSISSPITRQTLDHVQEETDYEPPLSQEVKSPAYPQGPVCIYDPHVYLYLEPSHIEAREFDVILNVAREVLNPFLAVVEQEAQPRKEGAGIQGTSHADNAYLAGRDSVSEPQTAVSEKSFASALEAEMEDASMTAPGTPKASRPEPEYIHVPWDHNTNVVDDLLRLCELIDNRVRQNKRVLVHCQCGVSRSASLVVAYGLYKNPQLTVQEAYDAVKFRSRWIGPNMNLIYQLSEFKSKLAKTHPMGTAAWHSWRALGSGRSNPNAIVNANSDSGLPSSGLRSPPQKSLSAPSRMGCDSRSSPFSPPTSAQLMPNSLGDITPGPSSAPPDMQWSPGQRSPAPGGDAVSSYPEPIRTSASPPKISDSDTDMVLSPSTMEREAIEEREAPAPVGGVANDLQEVAKDLDNNDHKPTGTSLPKMDFGPEITMSLASFDGESFGEEEAVPVARIRQDLQRNATDSDTDSINKDISAPISPSRLVTQDLRFQSPTAPSIKETEMTLSSTGPSTTLSTPSPTLPAGFSSLLSRRQGPLGLRQLPLRTGQYPPRLTTAQPSSPRAIDPDVPQTPSLLSPRAAKFTASPFHRTSAGDLAGSSVFEQGLMSPGAKEEDPRSPHQIGEAPITRNIFDML